MNTWVFGLAMLNNTDDPNRGENEAVINIYATTENYNYKTNNWIVNNYSGTGADAYEAKISALNSAGYRKLSYNIPLGSEYVYYRTLGITEDATQENPKDTLIGLPNLHSGSGSFVSGACDAFSCYDVSGQLSRSLFGGLRGGTSGNGAANGPFYINLEVFSSCSVGCGLRTTIIG